MSITRRIYFYLVTLVALVVFAVGVGQLLALLFDVTLRTGATAVGGRAFSVRQLSLGLAMLVIAGPLWFFFWRAIQRRVAGSMEEIGAGMRKVFLNLIMAASAFAGLGAASGSLRWLMLGAPRDQFPSGGLATLIISAVVWVYHHWISEKEGHPSAVARTLRRWYVYILSGFGLIWMSVGIVQLVSAAVLVMPVWADTLITGNFWSDTTRMGISWLVLGGVTWYYHWFRMANGDFDSVLRQVYFYLLSISGGAIAALVALTTTLYQVLKWVFGAATVSAGQHFQFLGWSIITAVVGVAIWGYHQRLVQEEQPQAGERRLSAQRVHLYLMSFIGLGTIVAGLITLFGVLFQLGANAVSPPADGNTSWWKNLLSLCLALLAVGVPLWMYYWSKVLRMVEAGEVEESRARSRRIFLYIVVGAAIGALIADLVNIVYQVLNGVLQGSFGSRVLNNSVWSLQSLFVAAPLLWYHWRAIRADQRLGAEAVAMRKAVTLLASDPGGQLAARLGEKLGYKVRAIYPAGEPASEAPMVPDDELERAVSQVAGTSAPSVILIVTAGRIAVYPYR